MIIGESFNHPVARHNFIGKARIYYLILNIDPLTMLEDLHNSNFVTHFDALWPHSSCLDSLSTMARHTVYHIKMSIFYV